jgi:hypothetical protein
MDAHGRSWTLMDAHGRSWTLMDDRGRSWMIFGRWSDCTPPPPPPLSVEFYGHAEAVQWLDLAGQTVLWRAVFSESHEKNGSFGNASDCQARTEINGNLRFLNEITEKLGIINWVFHLKKMIKLIKLN